MVDIVRYPIHSYDRTADTVTIASGVAIIYNDKMLVVRESNESLFSFPGGTMKEYESPEETALRELKEELDLEAEISGEPFMFKIRDESNRGIEFIILFHFYAGKVKGNLKLGSDAKEMAWKGQGDDFSDCFPNVKPAFEYFYKKYGSFNS